MKMKTATLTLLTLISLEVWGKGSIKSESTVRSVHFTSANPPHWQLDQDLEHQVSAHISFSDTSCREVQSVTPSFGPFFQSEGTLDISLAPSLNDCLGQKRKHETVNLGYLKPGEYHLNIFDNSKKVYSKRFSLPLNQSLYLPVQSKFSNPDYHIEMTREAFRNKTKEDV